MKKYYLHDGKESNGPFNIEQLKAQNITSQTPVWFEGMERWKTAGEIEELLSLFISIPPIETLTSTKSNPPTQNVEEKTEEKKILGLSKANFLIICGILIVVIGVIVINTIENNRSEELKLKNHKTEIDNYKFEIQQKAVEEQKIQMVIQEKIDSENLVKGRKQNLQNRLLEIEKKLASNQINIDESQQKLYKVSGFKLFRSESEKKEQISTLQNSITSWRDEIERLKNESNRLRLELEKIP